MPITIRDVAKAAGVSIATVSRVINNSTDVIRITREKVEKAIKDTGYKIPASSVRALQKAMRSIGLLMSDINNLHFPAVIKSIENFLFNQDYSLFICNTEQDALIEQRYINTMQQKGVDGIIFIGTRLKNENHDHIIELSKTLPVMIIDDHLIGTNVYSVMSDEVEGAFLAVNHLLTLGHKNIAFIRGDKEFTTNEYKYNGYKQALQDRGIEINPNFIIKTDPHERGGYEATIRILNLPSPPSAIFTVNDQLAIGAIRAIHEKGFSIPEDFSLVGFSDLPISAELYPPLTSVNQFSEKIGEISAKIILQVIKGEDLDQRRIILHPELSIRKSTGPAKGGGV